jgi:hypothetical protein
MVGFFFTGSAIMGILVSQFLARHSDKQGDRLKNHFKPYWAQPKTA